VRDAARVDDGDVGLERLDVAVGDESLADILRVGLRDLAPEETDGERRHAPIVLPSGEPVATL
jgi:hypothetical protein